MLTDATNDLIKLCWMSTDDFDNLCICFPKFLAWNDKYSSHPCMSPFRKQAAINMIYISNKDESTMSAFAKEHDVNVLLKSFMESNEMTEMTEMTETEANINNVHWNADGITEAGCASHHQMKHHINAYQYLCCQCQEELLTSNVILTAHKILMQNSVGDGDVCIANGKYRCHEVYAHAGEHNYLPYESIPMAVEKVVQQFNENKKHRINPIVIAANLFCNLLTIHPFSDGNGRLCRLMAAYAMHSCGTPFPLSISSGYTRSRRHYMDCILKARRMGNRKYLYTLFAWSVHRGWCNFFENLKYMVDDDK